SPRADRRETRARSSPARADGERGSDPSPPGIPRFEGPHPLDALDQAAVDLTEVRATRERHRELELLPEVVEDRSHAIRPAQGEAPQRRSPDQDGPGAQGEGLEHIRPAANAAIHQDLRTTPDGIDDVRQDV